MHHTVRSGAFGYLFGPSAQVVLLVQVRAIEFRTAAETRFCHFLYF